MLVNAGQLDLQEVKLYTESFPKPFIIHSGQFNFEQDKMWFKEFNGSYGSSVFSMNGFLNNIINYVVGKDEKLQGKFTLKADYIDVKEFTAFAGNDTTQNIADTASVQGMTGLDYRLSGRLDENMLPVYPSLKGGGTLSLKNIKLMGFKLMNTVNRETEHEELKDARVKSGINIKSTINNNIITIERVRLRIAGLRPHFEGQVSMDGLLNLKGRVGLPPLGIIDIPFTVSGTSDHPQVKLKRDKTGNVLQDTEDIEDEDEE